MALRVVQNYLTKPQSIPSDCKEKKLNCRELAQKVWKIAAYVLALIAVLSAIAAIIAMPPLGIIPITGAMASALTPIFMMGSVVSGIASMLAWKKGQKKQVQMRSPERENFENATLRRVRQRAKLSFLERNFEDEDLIFQAHYTLAVWAASEANFGWELLKKSSTHEDKKKVIHALKIADRELIYIKRNLSEDTPNYVQIDNLSMAIKVLEKHILR